MEFLDVISLSSLVVMDPNDPPEHGHPGGLLWRWEFVYLPKTHFYRKIMRDQLNNQRRRKGEHAGQLVNVHDQNGLQLETGIL